MSKSNVLVNDNNSSGLYSGEFSQSFGLELTTFPWILKQYYTYVEMWHHAKRKGSVTENV